MILQEIEYEGFRNLTDGKISFCDGINIFIGENGAGKTNLLEAIFFSVYGESFRTSEDKNMVNFNRSHMRVTGFSDGYTGSIFYNGAKKFMLNGSEKQRLSDYAGWLPAVIMSLNDIWIIRGAPAKRRNFLDWLLIKIKPLYRISLNEYKNILRQRNQLLHQENLDLSLLDIYNDRFIRCANLIYDERKRLIPVLKEKIGIKSREFGLNDVSIEYLSSCPDMTLTVDMLKKIETTEFLKAETLIGPHRDDFVIRINGYPAKEFSSEGECRILALLLKLIESEVIKHKTNHEPIFLLDEVTLELDRYHRRAFFEMIKGQIFYATLQEPDEINSNNKKKFIVKRGSVAVS